MSLVFWVTEVSKQKNVLKYNISYKNKAEVDRLAFMLILEIL